MTNIFWIETVEDIISVPSCCAKQCSDGFPLWAMLYAEPNHIPPTLV
jgi:hypothetical protein